MKRVYFITGTSTGVGKTFVAGAIACGLRLKGVDVGVMKPVESGCAPGTGGLVAADALFLKEAAGTSDPIELICPYRLRAPVAPNVAARDEGVTVDPGLILKKIKTLKARHDAVVVEGAGGLLSPLYGDTPNAELAGLIGAGLVIVAPNTLGVINHALLTIEAARARDIPIQGLVLNTPGPPGPEDESRKTNADEIARLGGVRILGVIPFYEDRTKKGVPLVGDALSSVLEAAAGSIDLEGL